MISIDTLRPLPVSTDLPDRNARLREAAEKLEATFLAEMLKTAGFGQSRGAFGGGVGEEQFSSFLVQAQADEIVRAGGIGLAESLFEALKERGDGTV
ncbi:rod-binding protein [Pseudoruegeria sp. HB172150]|uniref:rod-binding protein n=1 Tax=Pseudoruegeria sp. HB172150 TaxID=2721164 RepID=UPI00155542CD|nr:rod-binding protein [Pseudoruegeria sp. HB172150]